jgi:hypothetical protein
MRAGSIEQFRCGEGRIATGFTLTLLIATAPLPKSRPCKGQQFAWVISG